MYRDKQLTMGKSDNKSEFITQLFLYYKPVLTKEKQIQLLLDWSESCIEKEEYEMASTLKTLLISVEDGVDLGESGDLSVIKVPDNVELVYDEGLIGGGLPKIPQITTKGDVKPKKRWQWINYWNYTSGFTVIDCSFSLKKKEFTLIVLNYGVGFS
jgi:hypothetical protein